QGMYQRFLGRPAAPLELINCVAFLKSGGTSTQLEAFLLSSPEYFFGHGGGTNQGFVNALFHDVTGQSPDPGAALVYNQFLAGGGPRAVVASQVVNSPGAALVRVQQEYLDFLRRGLDPSGQFTWVTYELSGGPDELVIASIISSPEYLARL